MENNIDWGKYCKLLATPSLGYYLTNKKGKIIMARVARAKSETGIYHVMLKGIDKRNIFLAEEEYIAFLQY